MSRLGSRLLLLALVTAGIASCAHAQGEKASRPVKRVMITGSHIPQRVDAVTGLPETTSTVQIYTRQDLMRTGMGDNLAGALGRAVPDLRLDPELQPDPPALKLRQPSELPLPDEPPVPGPNPPSAT